MDLFFLPFRGHHPNPDHDVNQDIRANEPAKRKLQSQEWVLR